MNVIIASTSTVYGGKYLDYLTEELKSLFANIEELLFIPYARPNGMSYDEYTQLANNYFKFLDIKVNGIHTFDEPKKAIANAKAVFVGGGNTFVLVKTLYEYNLWSVLKQKIDNGMPYLGTSAGSNITGQTMRTTNDMPIVPVPSYKTMGIFPFNINPHYLDTTPELLKHMGETRDTRLKEYLHFNHTPVVALREGSYIKARKNQYLLKGSYNARVYFEINNVQEIAPETDLKPLFENS